MATSNTKARKPANAAASNAQAAPATTVAPTPANAAQQPLYALSAGAVALATAATPHNTLQAPAKGLGLAWRQAAVKAPNTRAAALAAVMALGAPFTVAQAQAALAAAQANGLNLGTGSPRSYAVAFVKNGYFAPVAV